jgi:hypothetical protein
MSCLPNPFTKFKVYRSERRIRRGSQKIADMTTIVQGYRKAINSIEGEIATLHESIPNILNSTPASRQKEVKLRIAKQIQDYSKSIKKLSIRERHAENLSRVLTDQRDDAQFWLETHDCLAEGIAAHVELSALGVLPTGAKHAENLATLSRLDEAGKQAVEMLEQANEQFDDGGDEEESHQDALKEVDAIFNLAQERQIHALPHPTRPLTDSPRPSARTQTSKYAQLTNAVEVEAEVEVDDADRLYR